MLIPLPLRIWLVISSLVVIYDASYVLLRPRSMLNGDLFSVFSAYDLYIKYDTLYGNLKDSFVVIQSYLNLVEVTMLLISVVLASSSCWKKQFIGAFIAVVGSSFVLWKTIIYVLYVEDFASELVGLNLQCFLVLILPTSFWLIFPLLTILYTGKNIMNQLQPKAKSA